MFAQPDRALAACLGRFTANVLCDAANTASGGALFTTFAGDTLITINAGAGITNGVNALAIPGNLTFVHNDPAGIMGGVFLAAAGAGSGISYTGTGNVTGFVNAQYIDLPPGGPISMVQSAGVVDGLVADTSGDVTIITAGSQVGDVFAAAGGNVIINTVGGQITGDVFARTIGNGGNISVTTDAVGDSLSASTIGAVAGNISVIANGNVTGQAVINVDALGTVGLTVRGTVGDGVRVRVQVSNAARTTPVNITLDGGVTGNVVFNVAGTGGLTARMQGISAGTLTATSTGTNNSLIVNGDVARGTFLGSGGGTVASVRFIDAGDQTATINGDLSGASQGGSITGVNLSLGSTSSGATAAFAVTGAITVSSTVAGFSDATATGADLDPQGIAARTFTFGAITATATSTSTDAGAVATGVSLTRTDVGDATLVVNGPISVTATAPDSFMDKTATGVLAEVLGAGNVNLTTGTVTATATGSGSQATGIRGSLHDFLNPSTGSLTILANGNVSATGDVAATGVSVARGNFNFGFPDGNGDVSVTLRGNVTATTSATSSAFGVFVQDNFNFVLRTSSTMIRAEGNVTATGDANSAGINVDHRSTGNLTIQALGSVQSTGVGIQVNRTAPGSTIITANNVTGTSGIAVFGSGGADVTVSGNVVATGGVGSAAIRLQGAGNTLTLLTTATLTGNAIIGSGAALRLGGGPGVGALNLAQVSASTLSVLDGASWIVSGNRTFSGGISIGDDASLIVNGTLTSAAGMTSNGGLIGGTGTLPTTTINNGGVLAPGNSIGTIRVTGNLTFDGGSNYRVEIDPTTADRTNVTGTANLAGKVQVTPISRISAKTTYTIMTAGTLSGTFGSAEMFMANNFARNPVVTYLGNDVLLTVDPGLLSPVLPPFANAVQRGVANAIDNALLAGATLPPGFEPLFALTGPALTNALSQISGPASTGASQSAIQMMTGFLSTTLNPWGGAPGNNPGAIGYARAVGASETLPKEAADAFAAIMPTKAPPRATYEPRWSVWGQGFGGYNKTDGNFAAGTADTSTRAYGFAAGADYRFSRSTTLGFALAGGETRWSLAGGLGGGRSDVFQMGVYGSHSFGAAYISGALAYAWYDTTTDRNVTIAGLDMLRANFDSHSFGGRLEGGYRLVTPAVGVTPYGAVQVQNFRMPGYAESAVFGANTFALTFNARNTTAARFEAGAWLDKLLVMSRGDAIMLRGRVAWAHDDNGSGGLNAVFQTLPGSNFTVNGAEAPKNLALVTAGGEYRFANGFSIGGRFDGEFASRGQTYAGTGTARYSW